MQGNVLDYVIQENTNSHAAMPCHCTQPTHTPKPAPPLKRKRKKKSKNYAHPNSIQFVSWLIVSHAIVAVSLIIESWYEKNLWLWRRSWLLSSIKGSGRPRFVGLVLHRAQQSLIFISTRSYGKMVEMKWLTGISGWNFLINNSDAIALGLLLIGTTVRVIIGNLVYIHPNLVRALA